MRLSWRHGAALVGCAAVLLLPHSDASPPAPELIYHHGVVLTMDDDRPRAQAVAVAQGRVLAVGDDAEVLALRRRSTRVIDLGGRTVMPGFIDSHAHWIGDSARVGHTADTAVAAALRNGWTSITESFVDEDRLTQLRSMDAEGRLPLRVNAYLPVNFGDDTYGSWYLAYEPHHAYSAHLRLAGIKLFVDHEWGTDYHWVQSDLDEYVLTAQRHGWQVAAHTVSALGHDQVLAAVEHARAAAPDPDARHRVEHVVQLRDDQLARMRALGVIASIQPGIPGDMAKEPGFPALVATGETRWITRYRDIVDSGVRTIGGTDMPWQVLDLIGSPTGPPHGSALEAVHQAMTRASYSGRPPEDWQLAQTLTVEQALRLFTVDAAYGTFEEGVKGTVTRGKYADLVVLTDDPTAVPVDSLLDVRALVTLVGGRAEYCGEPALC
ncbi:amidohydrolase [Oryzobacter telluris]|uniref:amidohydrolase n=1 Tax=Oryzobacter telluris TaxID=3149179 RepID=UPI00370D5A24